MTEGSPEQQVSSGSKKGPERGRKYSRREIITLIAGTVGGLTLCEFIESWLTLFPPKEIRKRLSEERLQVDDLSAEQKRFFREEIIERVFTKPDSEELDSAYKYLNGTNFEITRRSGNAIFYLLKTPDGFEGRCAVAINPKRIKNGEVVWFLEGTPPGTFIPGKVEKRGVLSVPGTKAKVSYPSLLLGEPNQRGFASDSPDFAENALELIHGKGLAAVGLWQLLSEDKFNVKLPLGQCLELGGYSGGANAALVVATRFPESIKRLFTFSGGYNFFHSY